MATPWIASSAVLHILLEEGADAKARIMRARALAAEDSMCDWCATALCC